MTPLRFLLFAGVFCIQVARLFAQVPARNEYLDFVRVQAAELRRDERPPASAKEWKASNTRLRKELLEAWGGFPEKPVPLQPRKIGELQREGYRIEKLIFQTLPGVWMTANAYVPEEPGKHPALLMVHGHWRGAKQDPVVQARCIGAVKLGFFVLVVDAFGAGERAVGKALGEYHGDMTAATLLPVGLPLSGLQVYENTRAVDYLQTRAEVDPERIGVTGASGGGNQSMYMGAWDQRLAAAVPVCSVGNYHAYLGAACCMCEVVPGALRFTEEWAVLGLVAPRALMVINATRDARQFSVEESNKSIRAADEVFRLLNKPENLRHTVFESGHDYSQPMREAVYGWMSLHLKQEGNGGPIPEPAIATEEPEVLRCFPGDSRADDWITIPRFAAIAGKQFVVERRAKVEKLSKPTQWLNEKERLRTTLTESVLGGFPKPSPLSLSTSKLSESGEREISFSPEAGITLRAFEHSSNDRSRMVVFVDLAGRTNALSRPEVKQAMNAGWGTVTLDLRATGELGWPSDKVGRAPDHTTAEWGLWIGRPLLGQWVWDLRRLLDAIQEADGRLPQEVAIVGFGPGGLVAMGAAASDDRFTRVATVGTIASFISEVPYEGQRLGTLAPGILKNLGDTADLAALVAPRTLRICGGVYGGGKQLDQTELVEKYQPTKRVYALLGKQGELDIRGLKDAEAMNSFFNPKPRQ